MPNNLNINPLTTFYFDVNLGPDTINFQEVSGLEMSLEKVEYRDGGQPNPEMRIIVGQRKYAPVTLKRGVFQGDNDLFEWLNGTSEDAPGDGTPARRDCTINLKNNNQDNIFTWQLYNVLPTKLTFTTMNAQNNEVGIDTLEICPERMTLEANG